MLIDVTDVMRVCVCDDMEDRAWSEEQTIIPLFIERFTIIFNENRNSTAKKSRFASVPTNRLRVQRICVIRLESSVTYVNFIYRKILTVTAARLNKNSVHILTHSMLLSSSFSLEEGRGREIERDLWVCLCVWVYHTFICTSSQTFWINCWVSHWNTNAFQQDESSNWYLRWYSSDTNMRDAGKKLQIRFIDKCNEKDTETAQFHFPRGDLCDTLSGNDLSIMQLTHAATE